MSRVEANVQYNYDWPHASDKDYGKYVKNCVGSPPRDTFDKRFVDVTGDNLVIDDYRTQVLLLLPSLLLLLLLTSLLSLILLSLFFLHFSIA